MTEQKKCAIIGHPVAHSLSPAIHRAGYRKYRLDWQYFAVDLLESQLLNFVENLDGAWRGLSVTMPHKKAIRNLGQPDELAELTGIANTLIFGSDTNRVYNTDASGFQLACKFRGIERIDSIAILGNGATARSLLAGAARLGASQAIICARNLDKTQELVELGERLQIETSVCGFDDVIGQTDMVASTVPAHVVQHLAHQLVANTKSIFDVIYNPWPTKLSVVAKQANVVTLNGLDLLAGQAVYQFELMTGFQSDISFFLTTAKSALVESLKNCDN